jgi:tol-pal system protein YbgF
MSACATSGDFDLVRQDLNSVKRESSESKKAIEALREKTAGELKEIDILKEKTTGTVKEDSFTAVRENQAEINSRLSDIANSLQDLRGRFEENKYYLEKTLRDSATERDVVKAQISALEAQVKSLKEKVGAIEESAKAKEPLKKPPENMKDSERSADELEQTKPETAPQEEAAEKKDAALDKKTYDAAYQAFKNKRFKEARGKFEAFIKDYPKSRLTDNEQFWIAESYYGEKDYEGAILAYETLLKKYPESGKTSGALLKQGFAFIEIGDSKTGKTILKKLIERFPDSKDAALAKKKLAEIEKKPGRKK